MFSSTDRFFVVYSVVFLFRFVAKRDAYLLLKDVTNYYLCLDKYMVEGCTSIWFRQ